MWNDYYGCVDPFYPSIFNVSFFFTLLCNVYVLFTKVIILKVVVMMVE